jgi:hypothetical protein
MIAPHETLAGQLAIGRPSTPSRSVFDRLFADSTSRIKNGKAKETQPKGQLAKPSGKGKIEDKLMIKHAHSQAQLRHLKALREAETLGQLQQVPSINSLSRELAMKNRAKNLTFCDPILKFRPAQSAPASKPPTPLKKPGQTKPPKIVVRLDEEDSDSDESFTKPTPLSSALESVAEEDYEDEATPRISQAGTIQRDLIEQLKRNYRKKDCLMEPEDHEEYILETSTDDAYQTESELEPNDVRVHEHQSAVSQQTLSYEDALTYRRIIERRKKLAGTEQAKSRLYRRDLAK